MLRIHRREVGGMIMGQFEAPCGLRSPVYSNRADLTGFVNRTREDRLIGHHEHASLIDMMSEVNGISTTWEAFVDMVKAQPTIQVDYVHLRCDPCEPSHWVGPAGPMHRQGFFTSTQAIDLGIWISRLLMLDESGTRGLVQMVVRSGLTNLYPAWYLEKISHYRPVGPTSQMPPTGDVDFREACGIDPRA